MPVNVIGDEVQRVLPDAITARSRYPASLRAQTDAAERFAILVALERTGSCVAAARRLEIGLRTLFYKMKYHGIRSMGVSVPSQGVSDAG
jgi:transcriptional regulator with GAF, ATPase, and Fis domain